MEKVNSILLVEDDSITNFINDRLLKNLKVANEVHIATNGQEALNVINTKLKEDRPLPELILLDLNMPVMDGFEFLQQFKKIPSEKKDNSLVIVLTTSTHNNDLKKLEDAGNVDYLNKPLTRDKILSVMSKYFPQSCKAC
ncbi:MAG: response regulator [Cytophagaceae bacterium]